MSPHNNTDIPGVINYEISKIMRNKLINPFHDQIEKEVRPRIREVIIDKLFYPINVSLIQISDRIYTRAFYGRV